MKTTKSYILLLGLSLSVLSVAKAQTFSAVCETGQTLG